MESDLKATKYSWVFTPNGNKARLYVDNQPTTGTILFTPIDPLSPSKKLIPLSDYRLSEWDWWCFFGDSKKPADRWVGNGIDLDEAKKIVIEAYEKTRRNYD